MIIHRDIKPSNIYIKNIEDKDEEIKIITLGDFSCAIKIKENKSESIGTILYNAPEMTQDLEYNEKVDLWSLGVTLYELYFGYLPYDPNADIHVILNAIYDEENFVFKKTFNKQYKPKVAILDILFKRLLTINPENRMIYKEFFEYINSDDFMKEGVIAINNDEKYQKIFDDILNEPFIDCKDEEIVLTRIR